MPNDNPERSDNSPLPESGSEHNRELTGDDDWGSDDAGSEPQTNDDHALGDSPVSPETADEEWDPWRGWCGPRGYQDYHTFRRHRLAAAKEQMHVDKSAGSKDGDAAHLDLRDRDRPDLDAPDVDVHATRGRSNDGVDQGAPQGDDRAPQVDDPGDLEAPDVDDDDDLDAPDVDDGATPHQSDKPKVQPKASSKIEKPKRRKNAITHGAFARECLLPGESRADLERLFQGVLDDFQPEGETQKHCANMIGPACGPSAVSRALSIASSCWPKRRRRKKKWNSSRI